MARPIKLEERSPGTNRKTILLQQNPFVAKTVFEADVKDVERFVEQVYGYALDISLEPDADETGILKCRISRNDLLGYEKTIVRRFSKDGKFRAGLTAALLMDMCDRRIIPPGEYCIRIW